MEWIKINHRMPIAYETGYWDGKRSELVVFIAYDKTLWIGRLYETILDGIKTNEWYSQDDQIGGVTHWHPLPSLPE